MQLSEVNRGLRGSGTQARGVPRRCLRRKRCALVGFCELEVVSKNDNYIKNKQKQKYLLYLLLNVHKTSSGYLADCIIPLLVLEEVIVRPNKDACINVSLTKYCFPSGQLICGI